MELTPEAIMRHLKTSGLQVEVFPCVPSTNSLLKERGHAGAPHGLVLVAEEQTAGRGRMGRSFFSPHKTGVYFSVLLRPTLAPTDSLLITTAAAVAAARALERISGAYPEIKWVNDIYMDGKKVCGILTEAAVAPGGKTLQFAVLGIGINLQPPKDGFPQELETIAGTVLSSDTDDFRGKVVAEVLNEFFSMYPRLEKREFISEYQSRSMLNGKAVNVIKGDRTLHATALFVADDLSLAVRYETGETEYLYSGDVSIRTR